MRCEKTRSFGCIKLQDWYYHIERWMGNIELVELVPFEVLTLMLIASLSICNLI
jgi:hypothetical protein